MRFTLNGEPVEAQPLEGESLLELLRERLGVRSVKDGCAPEGSCGACTVLVDGRAVVSCAQKASRVEGKEVVTHAGLPEETRRIWAESFVATGASQCGFCSPGVVLKAEALVRKNPSPTRDEVAHALLGNLCRCTGYVKILDAVERAAAARRGEPVPEVDRSGRVGSRSARYEGDALALGDKPFVGDLVVPEMLHGALRFSDHPRARVLRVDTSRAEAYPGVVAVVTAADVPGERTQGVLTRDWRQLVAVGEETAYVGDVLAAVAAETRRAAREAAALVEVAYEVLEPITDPHDPRAQVLSVSRVERGDVDAALADALHVVTQTFRTQVVEHAFLEPESSLAVPEDDGRLHVYSQGQGVWEDRRQLASFLDVPESDVRVTQVSAGGAFGAKEDLDVQAHAALLATVSRRPVLLTLTRRESLRFHAKRHPMWLEYTAGCDFDGRLVALRARIVGDTGAYASVGDKVLERAAGHACGAYRVPNVDVRATAVYTNNPPCGAMRGFGVNQANFALEGVLDLLAERVGIDGWEMRWRNALETGDRFGTGQRLGPGVGLKRTLLAVRDAYRGARYAGIACGAKNTGIGNGVTERGRVLLRPEQDGTVTLLHSWTEMGQGVHTVLQQLACEELGLPPERIRIVVDTSAELDTGQTTASRSTVLGGRAVLDAARKLKAAGPPEELVGREFAGEFTVDWTTANDAADPVTHLAYAWVTQVVVLDDDGRIARVVAAHDVGRAINPTLVEGQIEGGAVQGLGLGVLENCYPYYPSAEHRGGQFGSYLAPGFEDLPKIDTIIIENPSADGPYGAKGIGEMANNAQPPAIAAAVHDAVGVWVTELPITPEKVLRALDAKAAPARDGKKVVFDSELSVNAVSQGGIAFEVPARS
ncbi:MAG TPA: selenium-dependent xanthine dehydrogenase [Gaiellaceae bacterium]|nr:selenium-dependent xanthine dehydrogenase [Gaiellaceae bacterium]